MKKNKIAGLIIASALLVGASGSAAHTTKPVKTNTNDKNIKDVSLLAGPSQGLASEAMVVNGNGNLVLRTQGNENSKIVANISVGEMLKIESYNTNWYKVTVKETGATGYISASNLRFIESGLGDNSSSMNNYGKVINVSSSLNVRNNASISSNVINTLSEGANVKILAKQGEWYKIKADGTVGYVYGGYIKVGSEIQTSSNTSSNTSVTSNASNASSNTSSTTKSNTNTSSKASTNSKASATTTQTQTQVAPTKKEATKSTDSKATKVEKANTTDSNTKSENTQNNTNTVAKSQQAAPQSFRAVIPQTTNNTQNNQNEQNNQSAQSNQNSQNTNENTQVAQTGSVTLTFMNDATQQLLSNANISINGDSYTTNSQGRVTLSDLNVGQTNFNITTSNYNATSTTVNVKAGKRMTGLVYVTPVATSNNSQANNNDNNNNSQANNNNNNNSQANNNNNQVSNNNNQNNSNSNNNQANSNSSSNQTVTNSSNVSQLQQQIVNYAEQFLGRPYVWGATGPNAFDCSGLTSYVYKHFGYYIGRTTYTQVDKGTPVSLNDLEPGDLIFWGDPSAPYHVAIYIGNGQYIQAPKPGENVDISSWNLNNISAAVRIV